MTETHTHTTHADIVNRLLRADGHLRSVIEMIEQGRPCLDIAQQLQAVEKAITQAKKTLIHDHIDHCLDSATVPAGQNSRARVEEFKLITKYL